MYLSKENFTCLKEQFTVAYNLLCLTIYKLFIKKTGWNQISTLVNIVDPDQLASKKPADQDQHCFQCNVWARND